MSNNMQLWESVKKTDPAHVKAITGKSYSGNSPKPYYLVQRATETFGPCGIGWGFSIIEERIVEGAGGEKMSIARVKVWFEWEGKRGEVEHIGGTRFSGKRSSGKDFTDEDAPKKSVTDALVKALSMVGFAGDIFIGLYDDSKYVSELKDEKREETKPSVRPRLAQLSLSEKEKAARIRAEEKMSAIRTALSPLDSYQQAEWLRNNPSEVEAIKWLKAKMPDLYAEISGLGVEV